jgi:hypothetical protein
MGLLWTCPSPLFLRFHHDMSIENFGLLVCARAQLFNLIYPTIASSIVVLL